MTEEQLRAIEADIEENYELNSDFRPGAVESLTSGARTLVAEVRALKRLLAGIEWEGPGEYSHACPYCKADRPETRGGKTAGGHAPDCALAAHLR